MGNFWSTDTVTPPIGTDAMTQLECMAFGSEYVWSDEGLCLTFDEYQDAERIKCETNGGLWE